MLYEFMERGTLSDVLKLDLSARQKDRQPIQDTPALPVNTDINSNTNFNTKADTNNNSQNQNQDSSANLISVAPFSSSSGSDEHQQSQEGKEKNVVDSKKAISPPFATIASPPATPILSRSDQFKIAISIVEGLMFLHSQHVAHRDIKPQNILLDASLNAKLSDFGLAVHDADTRTAAGTPMYQAPEVFVQDTTEGMDVDPKLSDIYSLGIVLCEIFDDDHIAPWYNKAVLSIPRAHADGEPRSELVHVSPAELNALIVACMSVDPQQRPPLDQVATVLRQLS